MNIESKLLWNTIGTLFIAFAVVGILHWQKYQMKVNRKVAENFTKIENELFKRRLKGKSK